jgi:ABC-type lipoprotein export system ATPase subunit
MSLQFNQVVPSFLIDHPSIESELWNKTITFNRGEHVLISAESGRGKSTMLGILFGLRKGYRGDVRFNDESLTSFSFDQWSRIRSARIALLFQELRLFEMLTVQENLELKWKLTKHRSLHEAQQWLEELEVSAFLKRKVSTLSYGQQQRVALARTLLQPMEWLLLDEPFSHLDEKNQSRCESLILRIAEQEGAGIIATTLGYTYQLRVDKHLTI